MGNTFRTGKLMNGLYVDDNGCVGIGTTSLSAEGNLFLGAKSTLEGGQLVLQKGTSQTLAAHIDNYSDRFRIMKGTDTGSTAELMCVNLSSGNAGIGTSSPSTLLHLSGIDSTLTLQGTRGTGGTHTIGASGSNNTNLSIVASSAMYLTTNNVDRLVISSDGEFLFKGGTNSIITQNMDKTGWSLYRAYANSNALEFQIRTGVDGAGNYVRLGNYTSNDLLLMTAATERMRITNGGDILIGGGNSSSQSAVSTCTALRFPNQYSNGYTDAGVKLFIFNSGSTIQGFTAGPSYDLQYHSSGSSSGRHAFYVSNNEIFRITSGSLVSQMYINLTDVVSQVDNASTWPVMSFSGANGASGVNKSAGSYDWGIIKAPTSYGYYGRVVGGFHAASSVDQGFITSGWTMQFIVNGSNGNAFLRGTLSQGSDARIKANVIDLPYGLADLMKLRAVSYNKKKFNKDEDGNILSEEIDISNKYIGFIAQEVKKILPEVVNGDENSVNPERGLSIEYQNMTAILTKAIQELKAEKDSEIEQLKAEIEILKNK